MANIKAIIKQIGLFLNTTFKDDINTNFENLAQKDYDNYNELKGFVDDNYIDLKTATENHILSSQAHPAEKITYTGNVAGANNVKDGLNLLDSRVDAIITTPADGVSAQEIIDARKGEATLGTRLDDIDSQLAETLAETVTGWYNGVTSFGVPIDGTSDAAIKINNAINTVSVTGGGVVFLPPIKYKLISSPIIMKSGVILYAPSATFDMSEVKLYNGSKYGIYASGTVGDSILLASDATKGKYSFDLASVIGLSVGDWVQLATQGVNYYPYKSGYDMDRGEIKRIRKIDGNTVTFETAIYDTYTVANAAFVKKVNFVEDIQIEGLTVIGDQSPESAEHGIYLKYVNGFKIKDCKLQDQDYYLIGLVSSIRGEVNGCELRATHYNGTLGSIFYGIAVVNCCQWIRIHHTHAERVRHHTVTVAYSTGQGLWGQPRFINVDGNMAVNMMAGDAGRSWAFEHHGAGDAIIFDSNIIDSCYSGFNLEGGGVTISNNIIRNWRNNAIEIDLDGKEFKDIVIIGNEIKDRTTETGSTGINAITMNFTSTDVIENIKIADNIMNCDLTAGFGISINSDASLDAINFVVSDNEIRNTSDNLGNSYAIYVSNVNDIKVRDNDIYDTRQGIHAGGESMLIEGNSIDIIKSRTLTGGYAIYIAKKDCWINENKIRRSFYGVTVIAGLTNIIIANNIIYADSVTISDAGTGTTKQNNIEVTY